MLLFFLWDLSIFLLLPVLSLADLNVNLQAPDSINTFGNEFDPPNLVSASIDGANDMGQAPNPSQEQSLKAPIIQSDRCPADDNHDPGTTRRSRRGWCRNPALPTAEDGSGQTKKPDDSIKPGDANKAWNNEQLPEYVIPDFVEPQVDYKICEAGFDYPVCSTNGNAREIPPLSGLYELGPCHACKSSSLSSLTEALTLVILEISY